MTEPAIPIPGQYGGARPGSGRKKKTELNAPGDPYIMLAKAKAKHEIFKANIAELEFKQRGGQLLERGHVEMAAARLHSFLAQSLRNLPDDLERRCGLDVSQAQFVQDYVDALTLDLEARLHEF